MATSHLNGDFALKRGETVSANKCHKTRSSLYNTSVINTKTNTSTTNPLSPLGLPCILTFDSFCLVSPFGRLFHKGKIDPIRSE